ncbi:hypothetical protein ACFL1H_02970 [Nanoarchaeota archaeon]
MPRKKQKTNMINHRGLESDSFVALPDNEPVKELYNAYWGRFGIPSELRISPLDEDQYTMIITDATEMEVQREKGKVKMSDMGPVGKPGGSNGFYVNDTEFEGTLDVVYAMLDAGVKQKFGIALPMDEMYNRAIDNDDRLTKTILRLSQLPPDLQRKAKGLKDGEALTLKQFEKIYGEVKDKEFYSFPPHSMEKQVRLLPRFAEAIKNQQTISTSGGGKSPVRIIPFAKDGLYPLIPPDDRGRGANQWDVVFETWYAGRQGEVLRNERKTWIAGACIDYSVGLTSQWMKDTGYDVSIFAPAVKGLGIIPKEVVFRNLAEAYGINIVWDWPKEFGPAPKNWDKMLDRVKLEDKQRFEGSGMGSWKMYVESVQNYVPR